MIKRVVHANQLTTVEEVINYTKAGARVRLAMKKSSGFWMPVWLRWRRRTS
ncbi:hypothetical protein P4S72_21610 [Vibrio sp. PP-XX7]